MLIAAAAQEGSDPTLGHLDIIKHWYDSAQRVSMSFVMDAMNSAKVFFAISVTCVSVLVSGICRARATATTEVKQYSCAGAPSHSSRSRPVPPPAKSPPEPPAQNPDPPPAAGPSHEGPAVRSLSHEGRKEQLRTRGLTKPVRESPTASDPGPPASNDDEESSRRALRDRSIRDGSS